MKPKVRARATSVRKVSGVTSQRDVLAADQRVVESDLDLETEAARIGPQFAETVAAGDPNRLEHLDIAARRRERHDAGLLDGGNEGGRAAVHDRHFRTVDLDQRIVDAEAGQRGEHMLGGRAQRPIGIAEHGREFGGGDRAHIGAHFPIGTTLDAGAHEADAVIRIGRVDREGDRQARMDPDARLRSRYREA